MEPTGDMLDVIRLPEQEEFADNPSHIYLNDAEEKLADANVVILTDADADGIFAASLIEDTFSDTLSVEIVPVGPHRSILFLNQALSILNRFNDDKSVWVLDTSADTFQDWQIEDIELTNQQHRIYYFDHHEWGNTDRIEYIDEHTTYFELDGNAQNPWTLNGETFTERCTTQMIYDYLTANGVEFSETVEDRVKAVNAGDLWLKDDNDEFKHPLTETLLDSVEYISSQDRHSRITEPYYGYKPLMKAFVSEMDITDSVLTKWADEYRTQLSNEVATVFENFDILGEVETINGVTYAAVYANIAPNAVVERLREEYDADACAILRPNGRASFRGSEGVYENCHTIAGDLNGGGHKMASGGSLDSLSPYDSQEELIEDNAEQLRTRVIEEMEDYREK